MNRTSAAAVVLFVFLHSTGNPVGQGVPDPTNLFRDYERARYDLVTEALENTRDFSSLRKDIEKAAPAWIESHREGQSRRRALAATVGLEAARVALAHWETASQLIQWAGKLVRAGDVSPSVERNWQLAAVALIQGSYDREFLVDHLRHVESRFPDEPRFTLARAVAAELETWPGPRQPIFDDEAEARSRASRAFARGAAPMHRDMRAVRVWNLIPVLQPLTSRPVIGAEARLRLGHVYYRVGRNNLAIEELRRAEADSTDAFVIFLARLFQGRAMEATGDRPAAIAAYSAAIEIVPRAQSASVPLAALLFSGGHSEEANRLIEAALGTPHSLDPWRLYQAGDFRSWSALIDRVRADLK